MQFFMFLFSVLNEAQTSGHTVKVITLSHKNTCFIWLQIESTWSDLFHIPFPKEESAIQQETHAERN